MKETLTKIHRYIHERAKRGLWHLIDHFIPHEGNKYHPHFLRHHVLFGYSAILILLKVIVVLGPLALPSSSLYSSAITPSNIIALTNQARENLDLGRLLPNEALARAAEAKATDMLANQYFAHTSPSGRTPWDWIRDTGYIYQNAGENLAVHFYEAEDVEAAWMASPTHRANIVNTKYNEIGVGVATGQFENVPATFVVQMFGKPRSVKLAAAPSAEEPAITKESPQPSASVAEPLPAAEEPVIEIPSPKESPVKEVKVVVASKPETIKVTVSAPEAKIVQAQLAGEQVNLNEDEQTNSWQGEITYNSLAMAKGGEPLTVTSVGEDNVLSTEPVALVSPGVDTRAFYIFNEGTNKYTTIFGSIKVGNLDDKVRMFYLGFIVFLSAGVLAYLFLLRLRIRHPSVITHSVAVIGLALFLLVF